MPTPKTPLKCRNVQVRSNSAVAPRSSDIIKGVRGEIKRRHSSTSAWFESLSRSKKQFSTERPLSASCKFNTHTGDGQSKKIDRRKLFNTHTGDGQSKNIDRRKLLTRSLDRYSNERRALESESIDTITDNQLTQELPTPEGNPGKRHTPESESLNRPTKEDKQNVSRPNLSIQ